MTLKEINEEFIQLRSELDDETLGNERMDEIELRMNELSTTRAELETKIEKREALISEALVTNDIVEKPQEGNGALTMEKYTIKSPEYRSAYFKKMADEVLNEVEERAFTHVTSNFGGSLPVETLNMIWSNMEESHPILGDITLYRTGSILEVTLHNAIAAGDAAVTAQGVAPADEENTFAKVTLSGKDFAKVVYVSYALGTMSGGALEQYLTSEIGERLGAALAADIVAQITADTATANKVTSAEVKETTYAELNSLFALLKQAKDKVIYANDAAIYGYLTSIVDTTGRPIFLPDANSGFAGRLIGAPVKVEDSVPANVFLVGAPKKVIGNMITDIMVEKDRDIAKHVDIYAGYARFECKLSNDKSFVIFTVKQV